MHVGQDAPMQLDSVMVGGLIARFSLSESMFGWTNSGTEKSTSVRKRSCWFDHNSLHLSRRLLLTFDDVFGRQKLCASLRFVVHSNRPTNVACSGKIEDWLHSTYSFSGYFSLYFHTVLY